MNSDGDAKGRCAELESLLSLLFDGTLDSAQRTRLNELLRSSADLRTLYARWMDLHRDLLDYWSVVDATLPAATVVRPRRGWGRAPRWARLALGLAVAAVIGFAVVQYWSSRGYVVGEVSAQSGAALRRSFCGIMWLVPGPLETGYYRLGDGLVQVRFTSGVTASVQGPAEFELMRPDAMRLHTGKISVRVPQNATGFTVVTDKGKIVDRGTEFGVSASPMQDEVYCFRGRVDLEPDAQDGADMNSPLALATGEGALLDGATHTPATIDVRRDMFVDAEPFTVAFPEFAQRVAALRPTLWLRMEPASGTPRLLDFSGLGQHGTLHGAEKEPEWTRGACGSALHFEGPRTLQFGIVPRYRKPPAGSITGMVMVYADSRPRGASIVKNWAGGPIMGQFHLGLFSDSGAVEIQVQNARGQSVRAYERAPLPLHRWHHIAFTHDGKTVRLFRNGREVAAEPCQGQTIGNLTAIGIGAKLNASGIGLENHNYGLWHGRLDEFVLLDRPLPAAEIAALAAVALKEVNTGPAAGARPGPSAASGQGAPAGALAARSEKTAPRK